MEVNHMHMHIYDIYIREILMEVNRMQIYVIIYKGDTNGGKR